MATTLTTLDANVPDVSLVGMAKTAGGRPSLMELEWLTAEQAGVLISRNKRFILRRIQDKSLIATKQGNRFMIHRDDLRAYMNSLPRTHVQ